MTFRSGGTESGFCCGDNPESGFCCCDNPSKDGRGGIPNVRAVSASFTEFGYELEEFIVPEFSENFVSSEFKLVDADGWMKLLLVLETVSSI